MINVEDELPKIKETLLEKELRKLGTPSTLKERWYQKILLKYESKGKSWNISDTIIWKGTFYVVPTWIGYLAFMTLFGWLFIQTYDRYGMPKMIIFIAILFFWRINMMVSLLRELNKKLS